MVVCALVQGQSCQQDRGQEPDVYTLKALEEAAAAAGVDYSLVEEDTIREAIEIDGDGAFINVWPYVEGYLLTAYWQEPGYGLNPPEGNEQELEIVTDAAEAIERAVLLGRDPRP